MSVNIRSKEVTMQLKKIRMWKQMFKEAFLHLNLKVDRHRSWTAESQICDLAALLLQLTAAFLNKEIKTTPDQPTRGKHNI